MIHTRLQLDPNAKLSLRAGQNGTVEVVILDPASEASCVIEMTHQQLAVLAEKANVS